jgi:dihydroorotase
MKKLKLLPLALLLISTSLLAQQYDIVIKGGHLIDPANDIDQVMDIAIKGNKIAAIEKKISAKQAKKVVDA